MPSYPKLKLVGHIPANLASVLMVDGDEENDAMLDLPFTLRISARDEAFIIMVCEHDEDGFYGFTLLYYQKGEDGAWRRWLLERPDLPREERWRGVDAPFEGLEAAIGYEERVAGIRRFLGDEDLDAALSGSFFNGDCVLPYGRYAGRSVRSVIDAGDFDYIRWASQNKPDLGDKFLIRRISYNNTTATEESIDENEAGASE